MNLDFNAIAVKAVYDSMTEEDRAKMVRTVVEKMLTEKDGPHYDKKTVIEREIERQIRYVVNESVEAYLKEHDAEIRSFVGEVIGKVLHGDERQHLVKLIADSIERGLALAD